MEEKEAKAGGQKCLEDIRDPRTDLVWLEPGREKPSGGGRS